MGNLDGLGYRGTTVVVTGGASGMGEATVRFLNDLGAKVHVVDIQQPKVACESFHQCDLSDFDQVRAVAKALHAVGPIDFVFPCAGLPPHITSATGMDALTHAVEAYISRNHTPMTDAEALEATRLIMQNLPEAVRNGANIEARQNMAVASFKAGIAFTTADRKSTRLNSSHPSLSRMPSSA